MQLRRPRHHAAEFFTQTTIAAGNPAAATRMVRTVGAKIGPWARVGRFEFYESFAHDRSPQRPSGEEGASGAAAG
jgi:hypothetical protein